MRVSRRGKAIRKVCHGEHSVFKRNLEVEREKEGKWKEQAMKSGSKGETTAIALCYGNL
jgi:hypothetical protein